MNGAALRSLCGLLFPSHIVIEDVAILIHVAVIHSFSLLNGFYEIPTNLGFTLVFKM